MLTAKTLEKIRPVLEYRCMVSGSEQKFLLGLGVSRQLASCWLGVVAVPSVYRCRQHSGHTVCVHSVGIKEVFLETLFPFLSRLSSVSHLLMLLFLHVFVSFPLPNLAWLKEGCCFS